MKTSVPKALPPAKTSSPGAAPPPAPTILPPLISRSNLESAELHELLMFVFVGEHSENGFRPMEAAALKLAKELESIIAVADAECPDGATANLLRTVTDRALVLAELLRRRAS